MKLSDKLLKIDGETSGRRIVSSIHKIGDQYAFLDIGWAENDISFNPFHWIGKMISEGPEEWVFENGRKERFIVTPIVHDDTHWSDEKGSMLADARKWQKVLEDRGITEAMINARIRAMEEIPADVDIY